MKADSIFAILGYGLFFGGMGLYLFSKYALGDTEPLVGYVFIMACGLMASSRSRLQ